MQRILSIDTSGEYCSIAIAIGEQRYSFHQHRPREHAQILLREIEQLAVEAQTPLSAFDLIVYGRGPGSFTGLRIAAGVAQGLALAANCPIITVSTLQTLAWSVKNQADYICAAIDARMGEFYCAEYRIDNSGFPVLQGNEQVIAPQHWRFPYALKPLCIGNGWFADLLKPLDWPDGHIVEQIDVLPNALDALELALALYQQDPTVAVLPEHAVPVYLRDDVTWKNKPKVGS